MPEQFDDPRKEAKEWFYQESIAVYETIYLRIPCKECRRGDYIVYEPSEAVKEMIIKNGLGDSNRGCLTADIAAQCRKAK